MKVLLALLLLGGCGDDDDPVVDDGGLTDTSDDGDGRSDARPDARPDGGDLPIEVGSMQPGVDGGAETFVPYMAGGDATLIWGPQGGIMITPTIRLSLAEGWVDGTYRVTLAHSADPAHADRFLVAEPVRSTTFAGDTMSCGDGSIRCTNQQNAAGYVVFSRLFNQLETVSIDDSYTILDVTVEGEGRAGSARFPLHLVEVEEPAACDEFEVRMMPPCRFRMFPGTGLVTARMPYTGPAGGTGTVITFEFTAASPNAPLCEPTLVMPRTGTYTFLDNDCPGVMVGDEIAVTYEVGLMDCGGTHDAVDVSICTE